MKCEHEGCGEEAYDYYCGGGAIERFELCRAHLAAWLRKKADEVEGKIECGLCDGVGKDGLGACPRCGGTGKEACHERP